MTSFNTRCNTIQTAAPTFLRYSNTVARFTVIFPGTFTNNENVRVKVEILLDIMHLTGDCSTAIEARKHPMEPILQSISANLH